MSRRESNDQQRASQTVFLSGPTLYLRLVEPEDARTAMIWRETPFPAPTGVVEDDLRTLLEQDPDILEANLLLLMCRREDDVPVGSVRVLFDDWRFGHVTFTPDRLAPVGMQSDAVAETLGILLPFLLFERNMMVVGFELRDDWAAAMAHVIERGGREQFRQRERYLVDGRRVDARYFQVFNPVWVEKLGTSPPPIFGSAEHPARVSIIRPVVSEDHRTIFDAEVEAFRDHWAEPERQPHGAAAGAERQVHHVRGELCPELEPGCDEAGVAEGRAAAGRDRVRAIRRAGDRSARFGLRPDQALLGAERSLREQVLARRRARPLR